MFEQVLMLALMLIGAHWLCDYPLQGQFHREFRRVTDMTPLAWR
ncbi:hypothetical protein ACU8LZ_12715 [Rhizobium leguminosarum]